MTDSKDCTRRVIISGGIIVSGGKEIKADMLIENGRIQKITPNLKLGSLLRRAESELLNAEGCYVFPGFIDACTRFEAEAYTGGREIPLRSPDDFESGSIAALAGGTTSVINCAVQREGQSLQETLDEQYAKALHKSSCNYGFHIVFTAAGQNSGVVQKPDKKEVSAAVGLAEQIGKTVVRGVSSYTVYMTGERLQLSDAEIFDILTAAKQHRVLVCCHCENADMVRRFIEEQLEHRHKRPSSHPLSRPPAVEAEAVSRFLALAQLADVPVYILNISAKQSLEYIKPAKKRGQRFFTGTCPHYLLLTDSLNRQKGYEGAKYICTPPLRKKQDVKALQKELMRSKAEKNPGTKDNAYIDVICSNHAVFDFSEQEKAAKKDFSQIAPGIPGAQYRPALIFTAARVGKQNGPVEEKELAPNFRLSPAQFSALMSENPAKIFGLYPDRGILSCGAAADITVWDTAVSAVISESNNLHRGGYTPYEGIKITGQAKYVLLGGTLCVKDGRVIREKRGRYLFRKTARFMFEN